jgi:predicted ester cyclase
VVTPLEEQLERYDAYAEAAIRSAIKLLQERPRDIIASGRQRMVDNFPTYGDAMYRMNPEDLLDEAIQELADFPAWLHALLWLQGADPEEDWTDELPWGPNQ